METKDLIMDEKYEEYLNKTRKFNEDLNKVIFIINTFKYIFI